MEQNNITAKHINQLRELDALKERAWHELLDSQEARLLKNESAIELAGQFAGERTEHKKRFEQTHKTLLEKQQRELAEYQKIQQFRHSGDGLKFSSIG